MTTVFHDNLRRMSQHVSVDRADAAVMNMFTQQSRQFNPTAAGRARWAKQRNHLLSTAIDLVRIHPTKINGIRWAK